MVDGAVNQFGSVTWTEQKLTILEEYLGRYTTVLKDQDFRLIYVDAFAGTGFVNPNVSSSQPSGYSWGDALDEPSIAVLSGSTRRAIAIADRPFDTFIFVE